MAGAPETTQVVSRSKDIYNLVVIFAPKRLVRASKQLVVISSRSNLNKPVNLYIQASFTTLKSSGMMQCAS